MAGPILTTLSAVMCPHGGQATPASGSASVMADRTPTLVETDTHVVAGCPFTVGTKYSPCVRIEWSLGASRVTVGGVPVLTRSSLGTCYNGEGAPQGTAVIPTTQFKAMAR